MHNISLKMYENGKVSTTNNGNKTVVGCRTI